MKRKAAGKAEALQVSPIPTALRAALITRYAPCSPRDLPWLQNMASCCLTCSRVR